MADFVDVKISWADVELRISSTTNIGRTTNSTIRRRSPDRPSELPADSYSWDKFKQYVATLAGRSFLFRDATPYLRAIDLPVGERKKVIRELGYMGITAGSLFPGLDGACEELKERNFEI